MRSVAPKADILGLRMLRILSRHALMPAGIRYVGKSIAGIRQRTDHPPNRKVAVVQAQNSYEVNAGAAPRLVGVHRARRTFQILLRPPSDGIACHVRKGGV